MTFRTIHARVPAAIAEDLRSRIQTGTVLRHPVEPGTTVEALLSALAQHDDQRDDRREHTGAAANSPRDGGG
ncbi:hypothetical protein [Streptomyces sp. NPDC088847]|uniref:hypothetical protein n=1 Tax=Streptomyces sp. NPDC088847 TaxID=3365909 RepID=UPI0037FB503E